ESIRDSISGESRARLGPRGSAASRDVHSKVHPTVVTKSVIGTSPNTLAIRSVSGSAAVFPAPSWRGRMKPVDKRAPERSARHAATLAPRLPGQVVLVLQGGGALGAYQVGVYEALHEAGIEPDWVIGTSIGAINAALIAGNPPQDRMERLRDFWTRVEQDSGR